MHNFKANYSKILEVLQNLGFENENFLNQIRQPKLSDLKIIAINLTSEYMSIDSEHKLFRALPTEFKQLIERSFYNRLKRKLFFQIEKIRGLIAEQFNQEETYFVLDSMPFWKCAGYHEATGVKFVKKQTILCPIEGIVLHKN